MPGNEPTGTDQPESNLHEVAGYRLLRRVGQGGMSTVFLSYDVAGAQPVVVKILADHLATSREFVNRFYREARFSRLLSHPNLVRGLAAGFDPASSKHYLILEFIDGPTAHAALIAHGRFPVGVAVKVGIDIARALEFLHSRHYVHRDVKPDNVLLHPNGVAKLGDLGLAKRLNDDPHLTSEAQGVGTSYYMAYEQALNPTLVDGRSDIFALGATLYHLLTGEVPFPGATHEEVIRGKEHDSFIPIREQNSKVPVALADLIGAALSRDPRERLQSAGELADALVATGLATMIPALGISDTDSGTVSDSPTRADLTTSDQEDIDEPLPPAALLPGAIQIPLTHSGTSFSKINPTRLVAGLLTGIGIIVGASWLVWAARSDSPTGQPALPKVRITAKDTLNPSPSAGGLPAISPQ